MPNDNANDAGSALGSRHDGNSVNDKPVVVAIGASAGGLQALVNLFEALPPHTGGAFVVVVHLDPEHRSEMPAILGTHTRMPVVQVADRARLEADRVYVIAPDRRLQLVDHEVSAVEFDEPRGHRLAIDLFFRSVAERLGDGFAVILSGAGSDGAVGVRAVKEAGGIILIQDPTEAEYASMPRNAIATGVADFVLPVRDLAERLAELIRIKAAGATDVDDFDDDLLRRVLAHVRVRTGHDFSKYKRSTVLRRIARRMQVARTDDLKEYYDYLRDNPDESQALLGDLLISVTTFFRDSEAFTKLAAEVVPELFKHKPANDAIRVWVCGCATGEEAYSFAMLLLEEASRLGIRPPLQVFGSDLDDRALSAARDGRFPVAIEADVSEERLRRFFQREGDQYRVRQEVRDMVLFAAHDLLKDPPFSHVDLISCRNVLIYLDRELQDQACSTFHYALNPGGFLFLGGSESADHPPGLFRVVDRPSRIYQSTAVAGDKLRMLPHMLGQARSRDPSIQLARATTPTAALAEAAEHRRAIEQVAPPSMLIDASHRVIHLSENAGRFIAPSGGPLSSDAVDLVRPELRFDLRLALNRVFEQNLPTLSLPILVRINGAAQRIHLQVKPGMEKGEPPVAVAMFIEGEAVDDSVSTLDAKATDETVRRLHQELEQTQARLRSVREESDAANEELRAANEELQSINEEYRSTSEELETSKEELQSINEELQTVNSELKLKLEAAARANADLQNLIEATDIGTLFLDSSLRIKRLSERVSSLFSISQSDQGRPITDFTNQLEYEGLVADARAVLAKLTPVQREVRSRGGDWYDMRLRPYRTLDDKIDGVVITFVDVSERHAVEAALRRGEHRQQLLLGELSHRVRNVLAVIQAIARQTLQSSPSMEMFAERFEGRLSALASAHGLLVQSDWRGAELADLARRQLDAYATDNPDRLHVAGEQILLPADLATPFGLVLHELATNAAKHGALSQPNGKVAVTWTVERRNTERHLCFEWKETGGPVTNVSKTRGFGTTLIDAGIPGSEVKREFRPEGLVCTIDLTVPEAVEHESAAHH